MRVLNLSLFLLLWALPAVIIAQDAPPADPMKDGTIAEQFDHVIDKANRYKEGVKVYQVIPDAIFKQLESNVEEEISQLEATIENSETTIQQQAGEIESLKEQTTELQGQIDKLSKEKDQMNLLGVAPMKKAAYRTVMWAIIAGLGFLVFFFAGSSVRSRSVTKQHKTQLEKVRAEFDEYRKKTMEEDQKLRRKLQDEINKRL